MTNIRILFTVRPMRSNRSRFIYFFLLKQHFSLWSKRCMHCQAVNTDVSLTHLFLSERYPKGLDILSSFSPMTISYGKYVSCSIFVTHIPYPIFYIPYPISYILHSISHILHSISYILHSISYILHSISHILHSISHILHSISHILRPIFHIPHPMSYIPHPTSDVPYHLRLRPVIMCVTASVRGSFTYLVLYDVTISSVLYPLHRSTPSLIPVICSSMTPGPSQ